MNIDSIILAGGKSSRMGKDKALLEVENQPLISKTYSVVEPFSDDIYVVTPWINKYVDILPKSCKFIEEENPYQGALMAFYHSLKYIKSPWVLLLACDLPLLTTKELKLWINQLEKILDNVIAFLPYHQEKWECLCGFYHISCAESLHQYLKNNQYKSFQKWLNQESVLAIKVEDKQVLFNCNNLEDYQKIIT